MSGGFRDHTTLSLTQPRIRGTRSGFRGALVFLDAFRCLLLFRVRLSGLAVPAVISPVAAKQGLRESTDQTRHNSRLRRHGSGVDGTIHCRRQAAESGELARARDLPKITDHIPAYFSGGVVNLHD